ncbi:MAG: hypothetical protein ACXW2U_16875 [Telluria sp.]
MTHRDMVTVDREQWLVTDERPLEPTCRIERDEYRVRFEPVPGNIHVMGICGAVTFARAKVCKNDALVFDDEFDKCDAESMIRSVRFERGTDVPKILRDKAP